MPRCCLKVPSAKPWPILTRWEQLSNYLLDGTLLLDNNEIENKMRAIALGRKNYLFAGSHDAAQRAAMIYSFFAIPMLGTGVQIRRGKSPAVAQICLRQYHGYQHPKN